MAGLRYGFPAWCLANVGAKTPSAVERYFSDRGFEMTREAWRLLLRDRPEAIRLGTWIAICEIADEPLSTFIAYQPSGAPARIRRRKTKHKAKRSNAPKTPTWNPPNPFS